MRVKIFDGTTWPNPYCREFETLCWALRYNKDSLSQSDLYDAASVMEAYQNLITHPAFTLDKVKKKVHSIRTLGKETNENN